ncbi:MAG: DUF481 domain-containing protein [Candidatus Lernaella stagnicola]|nr:DUF481 domain-containing protein [Candidatus Lernaella stagnicola]
MRKTILTMLVIVFLAVPFAAHSQDPDLPEDNEPDVGAQNAQFPAWSSNGSVGYSLIGKRVKSNSLTGDLNVTREGQWTNNFIKSGITYGDVTYPDGDPIINANRYFGNYKLEGYLTRAKKPYLWALVGAESDEFQGFWGRYNLEGGVGYNFFGVAKHVLKTELGYAFVDTNWIEKKEIEDGEFHYWEPTHNGLARVIAAVPILSYALFTEEVMYRHNVSDQDDYYVESTTGLAFRLTSKLSFKTSFNINYTNKPGFVEELDLTGAVVTYDDDGDPATDQIAALELNERASYSLNNALVISFF